jgi:Flp pilus assembly protein TadG
MAIEEISSKLRNFLSATCGTTAITFAVLSPAIIAAIGIANDSATFVMKHNTLQAVADAAALGAAKELAIAGIENQEIEAAAKTIIDSGLGEEAQRTEAIVTLDRQESTVRVALAEKWSPLFAHFVRTDVTPIKAAATAILAGTNNVCVLALEPVKARGIEMTKTSKLTANGCGVYANSNHASAMEISANTTIVANLICSSGGISSAGGSLTPEPTTDCPPIPNPLSGRAPPPFGGCDHTGLEYKAGNHTFNPGVYCGGLSLTGTSKSTFMPGVYVMKDGPLQVSGQASIQGQHIGFYFVGLGAVLSFTGQSSVDLTGPKDGPMAGLLFYEAHSAPSGQQHRIRSEFAKRLTGTIYLSRGSLLIDPNTKVAEKSEYTAIVVNRLEVREGPELILNTNYGSTDVPVPNGLRASAQVFLTK